MYERIFICNIRCLVLQNSCERYAMKVAEKKHFDNNVGQYINNPDKVMAEVNILRGLKHVSFKNMVTFHVSVSVLC